MFHVVKIIVVVIELFLLLFYSTSQRVHFGFNFGILLFSIVVLLVSKHYNFMPYLGLFSKITRKKYIYLHYFVSFSIKLYLFFYTLKEILFTKNEWKFRECTCNSTCWLKVTIRNKNCLFGNMIFSRFIEKWGACVNNLTYIMCNN